MDNLRKSTASKAVLRSGSSTIEPEKLVIIIGAGASVPIGIPTMKGFTKEF